MKRWHKRIMKNQAGILIDNRLDPNGEYTYDRDENLVWLGANPVHKWHPMVRMDFSERFTWDEFLHYADTITDRLNAAEVEKKLEGSDE